MRNRSCYTCKLAEEVLSLPDLRDVENNKGKTSFQRAVEAAEQRRKRRWIICYEGPPKFYMLVQHVENLRMIGSPNIYPQVDELMKEVDEDGIEI